MAPFRRLWKAPYLSSPLFSSPWPYRRTCPFPQYNLVLRDPCRRVLFPSSDGGVSPPSNAAFYFAPSDRDRILVVDLGKSRRVREAGVELFPMPGVGFAKAVRRWGCVLAVSPHIGDTTININDLSPIAVDQWIDHRIDHLDGDLPLGYAVQDLYSTYRNQETCPGSCRFYGSHPAP